MQHLHIHLTENHFLQLTCLMFNKKIETGVHDAQVLAAARHEGVLRGLISEYREKCAPFDHGRCPLSTVSERFQAVHDEREKYSIAAADSFSTEHLSPGNAWIFRACSR